MDGLQFVHCNLHTFKITGRQDIVFFFPLGAAAGELLHRQPFTAYPGCLGAVCGGTPWECQRGAAGVLQHGMGAASCLLGLGLGLAVAGAMLAALPVLHIL